MRERMSTALPGVRTSAVQYEIDHVAVRTPEKEPLSQTVRQGNKKYSVSPIYQKLIVKEKGHSLTLKINK